MNDTKRPTNSTAEISGTSVINHKIRVSLVLSCNEYVMMDYLHRKGTEGFYQDKIYLNTGFNEEQTKILLNKLLQKGFLHNSNNNFSLGDKWARAFPDAEEDFKNFWYKDGKAVWPGSKPQAKYFYFELRKFVKKEVLIESRDNYFQFLELVKETGFNRATMAAERWLNPKNEYYNSNWKEQAEIINPDKFKEESKPLTEAEIAKAYE